MLSTRSLRPQSMILRTHLRNCRNWSASCNAKLRIFWTLKVCPSFQETSSRASVPSIDMLKQEVSMGVISSIPVFRSSLFNISAMLTQVGVPPKHWLVATYKLPLLEGPSPLNSTIKNGRQRPSLVAEARSIARSFRR